MNLKRKHLAFPFKLTQRQWEALQGYLYISPWFIGFLIFTAGPLLTSFGLSLTEWGFVDDPVFVGFENYKQIWDDHVFWIALKVTIRYTMLSVPLVLSVAFITALLMTRQIRGVASKTDSARATSRLVQPDRAAHPRENCA
jgi:multiple sugar transport system permease protein